MEPLTHIAFLGNAAECEAVLEVGSFDNQKRPLWHNHVGLGVLKKLELRPTEGKSNVTAPRG